MRAFLFSLHRSSLSPIGHHAFGLSLAVVCNLPKGGVGILNVTLARLAAQKMSFTTWQCLSLECIQSNIMNA
jgi:hypothetical protein